MPVASVAFAQDAANSPATVQEQIDELRARIEELEQQLRDAEANAAKTKYDLEKNLKKAAVREKVKFSGYIQSQFVHADSDDPRTKFDIRRARLKLQAAPTDMASVTLQVDAVPKSVSLKDAYIDLEPENSIWRFRTGKTKVPFMYEVLESSSRRLCPERSQVASKSFPGERDVGAFLHIKDFLGDGAPGATLDVGATNGQGKDGAESNNTKDIVARLRWALGSQKPDKDKETSTFYLGYLDGRSNAGDDRHRFGGGISYLMEPLWIRAEYLTGEEGSVDVDGWYVRLAYSLPNYEDTLFARYDVHDDDKGCPGDYSRWTVGIEHFLDSKTRAILAHELIDDEGSEEDVTTVRLQLKY
jgi:hypothetical protein